MSLYLDTRYLLDVSRYLGHFNKVRDDLYNFRCPVCGDSQKNEYKARGYMYTFNDAEGLVFKCHNCGSSMAFGPFLKLIDPVLHKKYVIDCLKEKGVGNKYSNHIDVEKVNVDIFKAKKSFTSPNICEKSNDILSKLIRLDKITDNSHSCLSYVKGRGIPQSAYPYLYYAHDFPRFVNSIIPNKIRNSIREPRLVIPFFDQNHKIFAFQGRALNIHASLRYITIKLDEDMGKIYGLDRVDFSKKVYVVEGPIDSLFLDNCLAVAGACYNDDILKSHINNIVIIPDNEPSNKEVMANVEKAISLGYKVCIWPRTFKVKDINDAISSGISKENLQHLIDINTFSGISAQARFKLWRKS